MDIDKSGTIDRLEWLAYLCSAGPDGNNEKVKDYYDYELREMFEKADKMKKGVLNQAELVGFLKLFMKERISTVNENIKWKIDDPLRKTADAVF